MMWSWARKRGVSEMRGPCVNRCDIGKRNILKILICFFGFWVLAFYAPGMNSSFCEEQAAEITLPPQPENNAVPQAPKIEAPVQEAEGNITLDFKDVDIQNILRILADKGNVNIVAGKDVAGLITIRLVDVSWQKALEVILKTYGYGYEWVSDKVIMVSTLENLAQRRKSQQEATEAEAVDTQIFFLNFSKADDIKKAVENLISTKGKINVETRNNALIISDTKSTLSRIAEVIKGLDKVTSQVVIEAKIIETTLGTADKLGIDWTVKATVSGAKRPIIAPFSLWSGPKNMYPTPQHTITSEDVVDNNSWIPNLNTTGASDAFIHPTVKKYTITSDFPFRGEDLVDPESFKQFGTFPMAQASDFTFGTMDFSQFQAVLDMLKTRSDTRIVSSPNVTTINNQEASIMVGTIVPIPTYQYSNQTGTRVISGYQDQKIGIKLRVTPNINLQNYITLDIEPSIEEITGFTGPDNERPIVSDRSANAKVMVKDGQTLVMGGLISEKKVKSNNKVPFFGSLPVIGALFTHKSETVDKTDLLIFITPRILKES